MRKNIVEIFHQNVLKEFYGKNMNKSEKKKYIYICILRLFIINF